MSHQRPLDSPTMSDEKKMDIHMIENAPSDEYLSAAIPAVPKLDVNDLSASNVQRVAEIRNSAYEAAIKASPINWGTKSSMYLIYTAFVCLLGACTNGYDGSLFSGVSPMHQYQEYFSIGTEGPKVSKVFALYNVGSMVGALTAGPICDRFGRRAGIAAGGIIILAGCIIVTTAKGLDQIIAGRFVLGYGIAHMTVGSPALSVEIAPPHWRGKFVGLYNCGWGFGSIPAAAIAYGCVNIQSTWSFRIPFMVQGVYGTVAAILAFTVPESPRWLFAQGRKEEAKEWLIRFHGNGDPNSALVKLELQEFEENIALDASDKRWWDYRALVATKNARWRYLMVIFISIFGQFSGNGLGYFQNVIYNNLGYTEPLTVLGLNLGGSVIGLVVSLTAVWLSDRMSRIKVLTFGTIGCILTMLGNALCSTFWARQPVDAAGKIINPNLKLGQAGVAFNYLFGVVYSFSYGPLMGIYPAENLETTTRAKGMAVSGIIVNIIGFINMYAGPIALQNMQNNYIYVFVAWDTVEALCWWFLGVETVGRTLEELDEIYNSPFPPSASRKKTKVAIAANGEVVGEVEDRPA